MKGNAIVQKNCINCQNLKYWMWVKCIIETQRGEVWFHFRITSSTKSPSVKYRGKPACEGGNYSILSMSKQSLRRHMGSGQLGSETHSSVCGSASDTPGSFEAAGSLLKSQAEESNVTLESGVASYLSPRLLDEVDCESWVRDCKWSWSEADSAFTVLQNSHRLYRICSRFCSSSVCSLSRCSFSLVCRGNRNKEETVTTRGWKHDTRFTVGLSSSLSCK